jgi:xylose isomerase
MDAFARGLKIAAKIIADGRFDDFVKKRYSSYDSGIGAEIEGGAANLDTLDGYALGIEPPVLESGRQEMLENLLNDYI